MMGWGRQNEMGWSGAGGHGIGKDGQINMGWDGVGGRGVGKDGIGRIVW